jgi:hypothetical protein
MAAGDTFPLGPGELTIGLTATPIDISCLVNNAVIAAEKDQGDDQTKLCGTVKAGAVKYTYTLSGNLDTDVDDPAGFFALSQTAPGTELDYTFTPSTAAGTAAAGKLIVDPLDFGGDTTGETMTSDFEFALVGKPTYTYGTGGAAAAFDASQDDYGRVVVGPTAPDETATKSGKSKTAA